MNGQLLAPHAWMKSMIGNNGSSVPCKSRPSRAVMHRDIKPANVLETERQSRLTTAELARETGHARVHVARACLCGPGELCFCQRHKRKTKPS